jgi:hypothetical protein
LAVPAASVAVVAFEIAVVVLVLVITLGFPWCSLTALCFAFGFVFLAQLRPTSGD